MVVGMGIALIRVSGSGNGDSCNRSETTESQGYLIDDRVLIQEARQSKDSAHLWVVPAG